MVFSAFPVTVALCLVVVTLFASTAPSAKATRGSPNTQQSYPLVLITETGKFSAVVRDDSSGANVESKGKKVVVNFFFQDILKRGSELLDPHPHDEEDIRPTTTQPPATTTTQATTTTPATSATRTTSTSSTTQTASSTGAPTGAPTEAPSVSISPTQSPSASPTESPTQSPSGTLSPTVAPTASPTASPTEAPSGTLSPTLAPTASPTASPTEAPSGTLSPTAAPTASPTESPTVAPTAAPALRATIYLDQFQRENVQAITEWQSQSSVTGNVPGSNNSELSSITLSRIDTGGEFVIGAAASEEGFLLRAGPSGGDLTTSVQFEYRFSCGLDLRPGLESFAVRQLFDVAGGILESTMIVVRDHYGAQWVLMYGPSSTSQFDLASLLSESIEEADFARQAVRSISVLYRFVSANASAELIVQGGTLSLEPQNGTLSPGDATQLFPMQIDSNPAATQGAQEARLSGNASSQITPLASQAVLPDPGTVSRMVALGVQERGTGAGDTSSAFAVRQAGGEVMVSLGDIGTPVTPSITYATSFANCSLIETSTSFAGWFCDPAVLATALALPLCDCDISQGPGFEIKIMPMSDPATFELLVGALLSSPSGDSQPGAFRITIDPDQVDTTTSPPTFSYSIVDAAFSPQLDIQSPGYSSFSFFFQRPGRDPQSMDVRFLITSITRKCLHAALYDATLDNWNDVSTFPVHNLANDSTVSDPIDITNEIPTSTSRVISWGPDAELTSGSSTMSVVDLSPEAGYLETLAPANATNPFSVLYSFNSTLDLSSVPCITIAITGTISSTGLLVNGVSESMAQTRDTLFFALTDPLRFRSVHSLQLNFQGSGTVMPVTLGRCPLPVL